MTNDKHLEAELEQALELVAKQRGQRLATAIRPILLANLERGRVYYYLNGHTSAQVQEYVWRVADIYERLNSYIYHLSSAANTNQRRMGAAVQADPTVGV